MVNLGTNLEDLTEIVNSGTNLEDLAERVNSSINLRDLAEGVNSGTNLEDLAKRVNSGTNLEGLAKRANLGTNLGGLAKRVNSGINLEDLTEMVNSGTNLEDLAERVNSGINLRDLAEWVNSDTNLEDLAKNVNSGTNLRDLAERANSGTNLGDLTERVNSGTNLKDSAKIFFFAFNVIGHFKVSGAPSNNKGWKAHYLFISDPSWGLDSIGRYRMDLSDLRGMSKVSGGKLPTARAAAPTREVGGTPPTEAPRSSSERPSDASVQQIEDLAWRHKKVKILSRRHKSHYEVGKAEELDEDLEQSVDCAGVRKGTSAFAIGEGTVHAPSEQEIDALKSGGGPEAVAATEERASELEKELDKTKRERDEALQRLEISGKELNEAQGDLYEAQRQLKEAWVRARRADDELLNSMKDLEST
ncbi:hypothetical protein GW17_00054365 [Ensete ventricosum]|nr:hypothetical protein GW17_00054365 [Ensete ventricosum]